MNDFTSQGSLRVAILNIDNSLET